MRNLAIIELTAERVEAPILRNIKELEQEEAAETMRTSQSTFQRIFSSAYKKTSKALTGGIIFKNRYCIFYM